MKLAARVLAAIAGLIALFCAGAPPDADAASVSKVREMVARGVQPFHCRVRIQVSMTPGSLNSGVGDFYGQDETGGISVLSGTAVPFRTGEWVEVEGWARTGDDNEIEIRMLRALSLGSGKPIRPHLVTVEDALSGRYEGQLICVRGQVLQTSVGETRDTLLVGRNKPGLEIRAYVRRPLNQASVFATLAPPGAEVEVAGISIPLNTKDHQLRLRASSDLAQVKPPPLIDFRWAVTIAGILATLGAAAFLWIVSLRRAVTRQTAEIRHLMTRAQESVRLKSEFMANMSHEIRTPMNAILGLTELTLATDLTAEQRENLNNVRNATRSLLGVVNDVLDFARIEEGKLPFREETFELETLIKETMQQLSLAARQKNLDLSWTVDSDIRRQVRADPYRLRQILVNLVSNSIKFTPSGSVRVAANVESLDQHKAIVMFSVTDTGVGIDRENQGRIFDAFAQVDGSLTRQQGGTGLGLSICARLVELFHGQIWVESTPGVGSTFYFTAQLGVPEGQDADAGGPGSAGRAPASAADSVRVLLVEDNEMNRRLVVRLLEKAGHRVTVAIDGEGAVALASAEAFDLILMDVQMPVMSGLEASAALRAKGVSTPIVAITAHALPEYKEQCKAAGMDDYLAKPIHADDLYALVRRYAPRRAASV